MPTLTLPALFLALVINRLVEVIKTAAIDPQKGDQDPKWVTPVVLALSLTLGALGVVFMFPSANLFVGLGSSAVAEQVATGMVIGGLANGYDFISGTISNVAGKFTQPSTGLDPTTQSHA